MFFKKTMIWVILVSILISTSSNSWFIFWLAMEINLMSFIPIMNNYKIKNCNSMITYFIMQSFSSSLFFIASFQFNLSNSSFMLSIINISLFIKLAIIPFHFWLISISESLNFNALFLLLSFQKIIPLFILSKFIMNQMISVILISTLFSSILALNIKLIKKLLIFSSIAHQGWMMMLILKKINFWFSYLLMYSVIIYSIIELCKNFKLYSMSKITINKMNLSNKINMITMLLSLGGMPPFLGFFMKMFAIYLLMHYNFLIIAILIISSLINLFFYLKILTPIFFLHFKNMKNTTLLFNNKFLFNNINIMMLIMLINLFIN
nr:NADH dehydrogenase subunit 2 [Dermacentor rhinocerinus]QLD97128.1 NADH dehydrogenase subunit 2 [Dermacentor rhinocerinus]